MTLLIVNDEINTARTMQSDIRWPEYGIDQTLTAFDADEAKKKIRENTVDLLLCDIEMPGDSGLDLLRWIREQGLDIECIFLTCHASFAYAQEAIELGCREYILIPARYEDIGAKVLNTVNKLKKRREEAKLQEIGRYTVDERTRKESEAVREEKEKTSPEQLAETVASYIIAHVSDPELSVDGIAETLHFHPVYINRIFKKQKAKTISQYILEQRMVLAASLLKEGTLTIHETAEKCGYSHYNNFFLMFKKYYGMSPVQFQKNTEV